MSVPSTSPKATFKVYIDESYDANLFLLAAVFVPNSVHDALAARFDALRGGMREHMRLEYHRRGGYPEWNGYELKHPHQLPEVHAHELVQSRGYYRKYLKGGDPDDDRTYWLRHVAWLEEAFRVQARFNLPVICIGDRPDLNDPSIKGVKTLSQAIADNWNPDRDLPVSLSAKFARMDELQKRPFTTALPQILFHIDSELRRRGAWGEVIFDDDGGENRGFRISNVLRTLCSAEGRFSRILGLDFLDSYREVGLQVADLHAYALHRSARFDASPEVRVSPKDRRVISLGRDHSVKQTHLTNPGVRTPNQIVTSIAMSFDYVLQYALEHHELRDELVEAVLGATLRSLKPDVS